MTLTTPRRSEKPTEGEEKKGEEGDDTKQESDKNGKTDPADVFTSWSKRLDRLGWTKVLVDVREDVPGVRESIASAIDGSSSDGNRIKDEDDGNDIGSQSGDSVPNSEQDSKDDKTEEFEPSCEKTKSDTPDEKNDGGTEENTGVETIPDWTRKDTWTAGELLAEFKGGLLMASKKTKFTKFNRLGSLWDWAWYEMAGRSSLEESMVAASVVGVSLLPSSLSDGMLRGGTMLVATSQATVHFGIPTC